MAKRVRFTVLCEDRQAQDFIVHVLRHAGVSRREIRTQPLPSREEGGAGDKFVRDRYANEVRALRAVGRGNLVVHVDADPHNTVQQRHAQLAGMLAAAGLAKRGPEERIAELVPKRNIETWIHALDTTQRPDYARPLNENAEYARLKTTDRCDQAARDCLSAVKAGNTPAALSAIPSLQDGIVELGRLQLP